MGWQDIFAPDPLGLFEKPKVPNTGNLATIASTIESRTPEASGRIDESTRRAIQLSEMGRTQAGEILNPFFDTRALQERNALLGLSGAQAQEAAISGIPVSEFDRRLNERQLEAQARQASVTGDLGGGAFISDRAALGSKQQADIIRNRLSQLSPLVQASQGVASSLSALDEQALMNQADILFGSGFDRANVNLAAVQPMITNIRSQGELSGLKRISSANQQAATANQLAALLGTFAGG